MPKNTHLEMRPMADVDLKREGVVAYSSTNNATHVSFTATSAPNSRYAAQLAEIALAVQQNGERRGHHHQHAKKSKRIEFWPRKTRSPPRALPAPASVAAPDVNVVAVGQPVNATAAPSPCHCCPHCTERDEYDESTVHSVMSEDSSSYGDSVMPGQWPREVPRTRESCPHTTGMAFSQPVAASPRIVAGAPPEVTRYRTERRTTYKARSQEGKIKVSAPAGTNEERLFDAIVEAHSVPRATSDQRPSRGIDRGPARWLIQEPE